MVFAEQKALQCFFAFLELRAYPYIKLPMGFLSRSAHRSSFESVININELIFTIFLWDEGIIISAV